MQFLLFRCRGSRRAVPRARMDAPASCTLRKEKAGESAFCPSWASIQAANLRIICKFPFFIFRCCANMSCDIISIVRAAAVLGLLPFSGVVGAAPVASAEADVARSYLARRLEVREDAATGRLVRQVRYRRGASPKPAAGRRRGKDGSVVQGLDFDRLIRDIGSRYGVGSQADPCRDSAGEQLRPVCGFVQRSAWVDATAAVHGGKVWVKDVFVPAENIQGGVKYLRYLMDRYPGQAALVLAAYNAGEGAVDRYGGIPPYRETQDYVARIAKRYGPSRESALSQDNETGAAGGSWRRSRPQA